MGKRLVIGAIMFFLGCSVQARFTTPVETVQTLSRAVAAKQWRVARDCFTDEMQRENAHAIETPAFYLTDYWVGSVTLQNFVKPIPIISEPAQIRVIDSQPEAATVEIIYPDPADKDVRLRQVKLRRDGSGNWKISELFGSVRGHATRAE